VLGEYLNEYVASRTDAKISTVTSWGHTIRNLNDFFGPNKPLRDITPGDADEWCLDLLDQGLAADSTVRKRCSNAKGRPIDNYLVLTIIHLKGNGVLIRMV
jgi:hypothetical protein